MSVSRYPSIELVQMGAGPQSGAPPPTRRWKVFFGVLIVAAAVGTAIVYARSPIYRASVSVLTVKPKAVDMPSADADIQHVAIQERLLLGEDLLGRLAERLREMGDEPMADRNALRDLLFVVAVPETNLLELRAQGADPALLQRVVNAWTASYETFRLEEIEKATGRTSAELEDELRELRTKIEGDQVELRTFKSANDIVSLERGENRELAALKGLNDSLNKARERLIEARARKAAIDDAIARGEVVVPNEQKAEIAQMRVQVARTRSKLAELRERYTDLYLSRDPAYRELPAELEEQQKALQTALEVGRITVRDEAQQALETARLSVATLQEHLATDQVRVQQFTERFNDYKVLEDGLASLLLSGIAPYELGMLEDGCFDRHARQIRVPGTNRRDIVLAADAWQRIEPLRVHTPQAHSHALAELDLHLTAAAHEASLDNPGGVTAFTLWYSYLAHLVRQDIDETALTRRVGAVPLQVRRTLAGLAPDDRGAWGGAVIEFTHPALGRA